MSEDEEEEDDEEESEEELLALRRDGWVWVSAAAFSAEENKQRRCQDNRRFNCRHQQKHL